MFKRDLSDQVCLVTGAASGLGAQFSRVLAAAGAHVICLARRAERIQLLAEDIHRAGGKATPWTLDVSDTKSFNEGLLDLESQFGVVTTLVNNAGTGGAGMGTVELEADEWSRTLEVNLAAPLRLSQAVARRLIAHQQPGSIINISSVLGVRANADADYSVSKAGLNQLTRSLALELAPHGILVNAIAPGYFSSEMTDEYVQGEKRKKIIDHIPLHRFGRPEELDDLVVLLASRSVGFMTGSVLVVDGGQSIYLPG